MNLNTYRLAVVKQLSCTPPTKKMGVMRVSFCEFEGTTCLLFQNLVHNVDNSVKKH